jgi:hypothetical protein
MGEGGVFGNDAGASSASSSASTSLLNELFQGKNPFLPKVVGTSTSSSNVLLESLLNKSPTSGGEGDHNVSS